MIRRMLVHMVAAALLVAAAAYTYQALAYGEGFFAAEGRYHDDD